MSQLDPELYASKLSETLDKLEAAFEKVAQENDAGKITVSRQEGGLLVTVKKVGVYTFSSDAGTQTLSLQSPESGIHVYEYDSANGFWKSKV